MIRIICAVLTAFTISGCLNFPPEERSSSPVEMPDRYSLYNSSDTGPDRWWHSFRSSELNNLVEKALSGNFDIRSAWAKLKQADAVAREAGADMMPSVEYSGGAEKSWKKSKSGENGTSHSQSRSFSGGLRASYEVDLWGKLEAQKQSETMEVKAGNQDLQAAAVTVSADVATGWIDILSSRQEISILKEQIGVNRRMLKIQELRFINGQADALDISQQREALAEAKALLPRLQLEEEQQLNAVAVLLGLAGTEKLNINEMELPGLIPLPPTGLPADLLAARPDVRAAGLRLKEADWEVSAARADRLPHLTLSTEGKLSSNSLDLIFSNWVSTLTSSLTGPIFDAGYRAAEVDRRRAVAEEYVAAYAKSVAKAIREVEDSLVEEKRQNEYILLLQDQLKASKLTLKDAHLQYRNGQDNYLDYLTAWTSVQALERQLVKERSTLLKNRVTLYRALGGDWTRGVVNDTILQNSVGKTEYGKGQSDSTNAM